MFCDAFSQDTDGKLLLTSYQLGLETESLRAEHWKQLHPEIIREYRVEERRDAIDRKRACRRIQASATNEH